MKTTPRRSPVHFLLLIALAVSITATATAWSPEPAEARTRPENTEPLAGDPTDTNDGPAPTTSNRTTKLSAGITRSGITESASSPRSLAPPSRLLRWDGHFIALRLGFFAYWSLRR